MNVSFYMDEHVHGAVTSGLRRRGVDVLTAQEDGQTGADDDSLLDRATELGRVLVSNDTDLLIIGARRQRTGEFFAGIIYAPQDNGLIGRYVSDLETISSASAPEEYRNRVFKHPLLTILAPSLTCHRAGSIISSNQQVRQTSNVVGREV